MHKYTSSTTSMILTSHQPTYLPWLGLFHKIALSDVFCYFDVAQFEHYSFENRNKIKTSNEPIWLSVPLLMEGYTKKKNNEMQIDNTKNWREKHWKSIYINYHKAPHFNDYSSFFENVYKRKWTHLIDLNEHMLKWFLKELSISVSFIKASELGLAGKKSDLVFDMCKKLDANAFIFGKLGEDYARKEDFDRAKIELYFQEYRHPSYTQHRREFVSHMSIIDLLFNHGKKSLDIIMEGNITKKELEQQLNI